MSKRWWRPARLVFLTVLGMFQQRYVKRHEIWHKPAHTQRDVAFSRLPKSDCFQAANFGGLIPTESWSFSSEKSYSPNRLICCQDTTEPFAMAWNRIPRAFAALRRCPALLRCGRMPWTILRVQRLTLSREWDCFSGDIPVAFYVPLFEYPQFRRFIFTSQSP